MTSAGKDDVVALERNNQNFLVACHRRPDADALGSSLVMAEILEKLGKTATVVCPDELSSMLSFLPGLDALHTSFDGLGPFDATFVMDTASKSLLPMGFPDRDITGTVAVIDHHTAFDDFADIVCRDTNVCSTGELVLNVAKKLGVAARDLSLTGATAVYAAIVSDTGGFRYPSTRPSTLKYAAELLETGVDPWEVAYNLFEGWDPERMKLLQQALASMESFFDGRLVTMTITQAMLEETGATPTMIDGLVTYARKIRGVEVAALLWEQDADSSDWGTVPSTKVSLRSRGTVDISDVAVKLGGGGHRSAAAACVREEIPETRDKLIQLVGDAL